jgi:uncharacterized protein (TIGR00269 family)
MECSKCGAKAVHQTTGQAYCKDHFFDYFETKVFRTIKRYKLISKEDRVCVATSGGKDSLAVLYMTMLYCKKYDIDFFALAIDEGIKNYRDHTLEDLQIFCDTYEIPMTVLSFKTRFGSALDDVQEKAIKEYNKKPCTVCGILRRSLLNKGARELGATKLVTGHNLDDEAQSFFMNILKGSMAHNASLGPMTGLSKDSDFVPRVKPLYFISEQETRLFAFLKGFKVNFNECPNIGLSFRASVRDQLNILESKTPGIKHGLVNSFLQVLPELKEKYKNERDSFQYCERCGEPCSGTICNVCKLEEELCLEVKH